MAKQHCSSIPIHFCTTLCKMVLFSPISRNTSDGHAKLCFFLEWYHGRLVTWLLGEAIPKPLPFCPKPHPAPFSSLPLQEPKGLGGAATTPPAPEHRVVQFECQTGSADPAPATLVPVTGWPAPAPVPAPASLGQRKAPGTAGGVLGADHGRGHARLFGKAQPPPDYDTHCPGVV